jgi:PAS domain S-box-containing protein
LINRNGGEIPIDDSAAPIKDDQGNIVGVILVFRDITERDRTERERETAEKAVLRAKEEWERTFNTIPDLIAILDKEHRVVRVNKAMADRLGLPPDRCTGAKCHEVVHGLSHPPESCPHSLTCRDGREHVTEVHEAVLGGDFLVSTTPICDEQNRLIGSIHVARNITERKRMEEELRLKSDHLEAANKELEAFTYSVSHDLKNPLRSIIGFSELLVAATTAKLQPNEQQLLHKITEAATRMNDLIEDLLAYSRLELQAITWSVVDLRGLIQDIIDEYQPEIVLQQTQVQIDVQSPPLTTDPSGLTQALRNLIGNAIKFSAKSPQPMVQIFARDTDEGIQVEVRDNGIGFDMKFRDKIFEIFQRLHNNQSYPGTGIGLAIVKRAISRVGGRVWAESEPGKGAVFFLQIPKKESVPIAA